MKIIFLDEYSLGGADLSKIKSLGEYRGFENMRDGEGIVRCAADAEVIIANKAPLTREVLERLPSLRLVAIAATGMNNIDLDAAAELGIEVRNAVGYSTHSVAEATLSSALALRRQISYYDRLVKGGGYSLSDRLFRFDRPIGELHGSRWGIIGMGAIGREVARLATAFGCEVRYFSTSGIRREEEYSACETLAEMLEWCDTLSIHAPLNDVTRAMIGEREFVQMKRDAIVINVARGGIVDEEAFAAALDHGEIAAAALDVYVCEPLNADSPLLKINDPDRLLLSTHNAWQSQASLRRLVDSIVENIKQLR